MGNPNDITIALVGRGVALNPPATENALELLREHAKEAVTPSVINIYKQFDGFREGALDPATGVSIWSIDKAVSLIAHFEVPQGYMVFCDVHLDAEFLMWNVWDANLPVIKFHERNIVADSLFKFAEFLRLGCESIDPY